jgi:hypothetical protein
MGSLSVWHWIIVLICIGVGIWIARILTRNAGTKACPQCAEQIKAAALVCRFCGYSFPKEAP